MLCSQRLFAKRDPLLCTPDDTPQVDKMLAQLESKFEAMSEDVL